MNDYLKQLIKKVKENKQNIKQGVGVIFVIFLLMSYDNSPVERFIKLSPEDRVAREEGLKTIDSIINICKSINRRYTRQKPYQYWYEDIYSFGEWYQPRLSNPIIKVYFNEEPGHSDNGSYCEVDLYWFDYEFYNWETFELGEDQSGETRYASYKNYMCSDEDEESRCTR
jgi:hypothetical protein